MSYAWRTLAGVTAALALAACQGDARSEDEATTPLASIHSSATANEQRADAQDDALELAEARCDWRCIVALGVVTGQLSDAIEQFGGLIESMPRPSDLQCWRADDDDWLLKLRCAYWTLRDDAEKSDDSDDSDEADEADDADPWGSTGSSKPSSGGSKPSTGTDDASSSDRGSSSNTGSRDSNRPGLGG